MFLFSNTHDTRLLGLSAGRSICTYILKMQYAYNITTGTERGGHHLKVLQLNAFCPEAIVYSKLSYFTNLKLFLIRVTELFEPIVMLCHKKATVFALLKTFSWEIDLLITFGDFALQKRKTGKRNLYLTEH